MTNGPSARIAEIIDGTIPRPRSRETIIEHPHYYKIRNHIIHFLVRHVTDTGSPDGGGRAGVTQPAPVVVRF